MNYHKIYYNLINKRIHQPYDGYTESHHILPKSLGGSDEINNLVKLSAREHFICHLLLTKMYKIGTSEYYKMIKAFFCMLMFRSSNQQRYITNRSYALLREEFKKAQSINQSGKNNSQYGKNKTFETRKKISETLQKRNNFIGQTRKDNKLKKSQEKREIDVSLYRYYYEIYSTHGWNKFVDITGYNKSKQNLVKRFADLLSDFVPQNGKRRGNNTNG